MKGDGKGKMKEEKMMSGEEKRDFGHEVEKRGGRQMDGWKEGIKRTGREKMLNEGKNDEERAKERERSRRKSDGSRG